MVDPKVSPEQTCILERFPMCFGPVSPDKKGHTLIVARLVAHMLLTHAVKRVCQRTVASRATAW